MLREFFQSIEGESSGTCFELQEIVENLAFNEQGLIPVITQDNNTKAVLMMAWMNKEALLQTLDTGKVTYWSRSRQAFWIKGETSGHVQHLVKMCFDCDGDAVLCLVEQKGAACHTLRDSCFYLEVNTKTQQVIINSDAKVSS